MSSSDPYNDNKIVHRAKLVAGNGDVSPLCAKFPKPLDLKKSKWTTDDGAVTCKKCKALIVERTAKN